MLYRQYYDYLFRFAYRVTRRLDRVEDIINEVMLVVWQKAHATEPLARASTWSMSVAHKKALCAVSKSPALIARDDEISVSGAEFAPHELTRIESNELFESALGHLTPEQRAGWEFVHYHEMHYSEIAIVMDIPENTVKARMFHARRKLRDAWPALSGTPTTGV